MKDDWKAVEYGSEFPLETVVGAPCVDGGGYVYTRSGRDALRLVASFLKNAGTDEVLLPCYCCEIFYQQRVSNQSRSLWQSLRRVLHHPHHTI